jgi:hypothetical protein
LKAANNPPTGFLCDIQSPTVIAPRMGNEQPLRVDKGVWHCHRVPTITRATQPPLSERAEARRHSVPRRVTESPMSLVRNEDAHPPVRMEAISLPSVHPHALKHLQLAGVLTTETVPSTTLVNRNTAFVGEAGYTFYYYLSGRPRAGGLGIRRPVSGPRVAHKFGGYWARQQPAAQGCTQPHTRRTPRWPVFPGQRGVSRGVAGRGFELAKASLRPDWRVTARSSRTIRCPGWLFWTLSTDFQSHRPSHQPTHWRG